MTNTITFFDKYQDLCKLTGAQSHKELWDAGFDLDDCDFDFVSNKPWNEINGPYYQMWLLLRMENHCIRYEHVEFGGRHYVEVYEDETVFVDDSDNTFVEADIGKTVFLAREEAERALED